MVISATASKRFGIDGRPHNNGWEWRFCLPEMEILHAAVDQARLSKYQELNGWLRSSDLSYFHRCGTKENQERRHEILCAEQTKACFFSICYMAGTFLVLTFMSTWRGFASASA